MIGNFFCFVLFLKTHSPKAFKLEITLGEVKEVKENSGLDLTYSNLSQETNLQVQAFLSLLLLSWFVAFILEILIFRSSSVLLK